MSTIKSFEDLPVWKDARKFTNRIYNITNKFPKEEIYGLTSQIRRATVSIMSNIAEGFDRRSDKELSNFFILLVRFFLDFTFYLNWKIIVYFVFDWSIG